MTPTDHRLPQPGRLYRLCRSGSLFVPLERDPKDRFYAVAWRCLTNNGVESLWLWDGSYEPTG